MRKLGFQRGKYNPCLYYLAEKNLKTFLHGDDFATVGTRAGVKWFKEALEKRFEIKSQCVGTAALRLGGRASAGIPHSGQPAQPRGAGASNGPAPTATNGEEMIEGTECRLLNRVVRCTTEGWEVEPDQRHADMIVQELALRGANGVTSPGEKENPPEADQELSAADTTRFRALAARANYLSADRPDLMYAVKELCRGMAKPTQWHWNKLKRLGRYLIEHGRTVLKYGWP